MTKLACLTAAAVLLQAQTPAVPVEPATAIIDAFRSHSIVAIGNVEFFGNEQCHAFQLSLIRDPRFAATVNDIVVEFGNARYQGLMDRFVRGEEVPYESLRQVWQNTTQIEFEWDLPIYEEFFRAVRTVNASVPRARQLRVLLADPPMDWNTVHTLADLRNAMGDRDGYAVDVLRREVLAKNRRALLIFGGQHLLRKNTAPGARGIVARLEKDSIASVFTVLPETRRDLKALQPDVESWPVPSLAILRGTTLGSAMMEQADAVLYLGPPSSMTMSKLSPALCSDAGYMEMRTRRLGLVPPPPGAPFNPLDLLKDSCAGPRGNTSLPDREPAITELIRETLRDAAQGKVDPARIAPESRERLIPFLKDIGPRFLGPAGALDALTLLADDREAGKHVRRYLAVFASGRRIRWIVGLSAAGAIVSLEPRPQ